MGGVAGVSETSKDSETLLVNAVDGVAPKMEVSSSKAARGKQSAAPSTMKLAMIYFQAKEYSSAMKMFQDILASDSLNYKAIYHLAYCYHELKRDKKARKELSKILSDSSNTFYPEAQILKKKIQDH